MPRPTGKTYHADVETGEDFYGADTRGAFHYPLPSMDAVIYDADYNFTGFPLFYAFTPGYHRPFFYDPQATAPWSLEYAEFPESPTADWLYAIDRVEFTNGMFMLDTWRGDPAFAVEGLYDYIGREVPERDGFQFWVNALDGGYSLAAVVDDFMHIKAEAAKTGVYGIQADPQTNEAFVQFLYQNILGYDGTEEGIDFWAGNLDSGAADRGDTLTEFVSVIGSLPGHNWIEWA